MTREPAGCLAAILALFGIGRRAWSEPALPYRLRDDFRSPAEFSFYRVLKNAVAEQAVICCKVRLADIFFVSRSEGGQGERNRIDRKHVDFLLCDPRTMRPRCGVELDDASHDRRDRRERDAFVDQVFVAAALPLVRFGAKSAYSAADIAAVVTPYLQEPAPPTKSARSPEGKPICTKCGVPMVIRTASRGAKIGQTFFGCPNFPQCRETAEG